MPTKKSKRVTKAQVVKKMKELGVDGWSSMGKFTFAEMMGHLKEIEQLFKDRKAAVEARRM